MAAELEKEPAPNQPEEKLGIKEGHLFFILLFYIFLITALNYRNVGVPKHIIVHLPVEAILKQKIPHTGDIESLDRCGS